MEDEKKIKDGVTCDVSVDVLVFSFDWQDTKKFLLEKQAARLRSSRRREETNSTTTSELEFPEELPNGEDSLKVLNAAVVAFISLGLYETEVFRLLGSLQTKRPLRNANSFYC